MKQKVILVFLSLILCTAALGQDIPSISKDGVGSVKIGMHYSKAKPAMSSVCKMIWEMYHDMIDMMQVTCFDNEQDRNMMVVFSTGEAPDDKLIRSFRVFSPALKTSKGFSVASTAQELEQAGGKLTCREDCTYILLDGLYYFFSDNCLSEKKLKPEAHPFQIANVPYPED